MSDSASDDTKILIHLASGQTIETYESADDVEEVDDLIQRLKFPPHPKWVQIGDALVFDKAIAGLELG